MNEIIYIVEIELDYCTLTFGAGECHATGEPCYNTRATCKDVRAYPNSQGVARGKKTYSYCSESSLIPANLGAIPVIKDVAMTPITIDPGKSLGTRGEVTVRMSDFPHHDIGIDPYVESRNYDPMETGTYWKKFLARNMYYYRRYMTVYYGDIDDVRDYKNKYIKRKYVIDSINLTDTTVTITGRDILRLVDDAKTCPATTLARIKTDMPIGAGNIDLLPAGAGEYITANDYVRIESEIIKIDMVSGDKIYYTIRGAYNTVEKTHKADTAVQVCKIYQDKYVHEVIYDLLVTYAGIDDDFIPIAEWQDESIGWLADYSLTCVISKPTGVLKLIQEITASTGCYIYYDEERAKIRLVSIKPPVLTPKMISDDTIIRASYKQVENSAERKTEIVLYYEQINPTESETDDKNYRRVDAVINLDAESPVEYGDVRVKRIYSRWLDSDDDIGIHALLLRTISAHINSPKYIEVAIRYDPDITVGDYINIRTRNITDSSGRLITKLTRVLAKEDHPGRGITKLKLIFAEDDYAGRWCYWQDDARVDYHDVPAAERDILGGWLCDDTTEKMPDGTNPYMLV